MDESLDLTPFSAVLDALQDLGTPFPVRFVRYFSDLTRKNLKDFQHIWPNLPEQRKVSLLEDLETVLESDTVVNFDNMARALLNDPLAAVRVIALRLLWECEETNLVPDLLSMSITDPDETTRATAAAVLGKFVLLGELETIRADLYEKIVKHLVSIVEGNDQARVKQRALESLGYSSHPSIPGLIQNAYLSNDSGWVTSALCAMGRSADDSWAAQVDKLLNSPDPDVQFEAVRAAGELELTGSREKLLAALEYGIEDEEIRLAMIWSLSQIGGDEVKEKLDELLKNATDDDEVDWIDKAIDNMEFSTSSGLQTSNFSSEDEDELDYGDDDLEDEDDYALYDEDEEDED
jgi:HEAT repeat protein